MQERRDRERGVRDRSGVYISTGQESRDAERGSTRDGGREGPRDSRRDDRSSRSSAERERRASEGPGTSGRSSYERHGTNGRDSRGGGGASEGRPSGRGSRGDWDRTPVRKQPAEDEWELTPSVPKGGRTPLAHTGTGGAWRAKSSSASAWTSGGDTPLPQAVAPMGAASAAGRHRGGAAEAKTRVKVRQLCLHAPLAGMTQTPCRWLAVRHGPEPRADAHVEEHKLEQERGRGQGWGLGSGGRQRGDGATSLSFDAPVNPTPIRPQDLERSPELRAGAEQQVCGGGASRYV